MSFQPFDSFFIIDKTPYFDGTLLFSALQTIFDFSSSRFIAIIRMILLNRRKRFLKCNPNISNKFNNSMQDLRILPSCKLLVFWCMCVLLIQLNRLIRTTYCFCMLVWNLIIFDFEHEHKLWAKKGSYYRPRFEFYWGYSPILKVLFHKIHHNLNLLCHLMLLPFSKVLYIVHIYLL